MADYPEPPFRPPEQVADSQPSYTHVPDYPGKRLRKPRSKKPLVILLVLLVIAGLGFGVWKFLQSKDKPAHTQQTQSQASNTTAKQDVPEAGSTKEYEVGFLGVKVTYPSSWTATEADNHDSLKLESPTFSYTSQDKGQVSGNFRVYIRKGARASDSKYIGRGVAIEPSEKLKYSNPVPGQRTETNLTLFGLDDTHNFAFFLIAGNYSLKLGDTLGPNYGKEAETFIVAGGFSSADLKDDLATHPVSPDLVKTSSAYKQAIEIVKSLQLH